MSFAPYGGSIHNSVVVPTADAVGYILSRLTALGAVVDEADLFAPANSYFLVLAPGGCWR